MLKAFEIMTGILQVFEIRKVFGTLSGLKEIRKVFGTLSRLKEIRKVFGTLSGLKEIRKVFGTLSGLGTRLAFEIERELTEILENY